MLTSTLPHIPVKETGSATRKRQIKGNEREITVYVAMVDGVEIGDFNTAELAVMEADWCAYYQVFTKQDLRPDAPIDADVLALAIKLFKVFFRGETMRKSGESAVEAYLSSADAHEKWGILEDGTLAIEPTPKRKRKGEAEPHDDDEGGEPYLIKHEDIIADDAAPEPGVFKWQVRETCSCPDVITRAWKHSGMCKHVALRTLLMMAQHGMPFLQSVVAALRAGAGQPSQAAAHQSPAPAPAAAAAPIAIAQPAPAEEAPPAPSEPAPAPALPEFYIDLPARHLASAVLFIRTVSEGLGAVLYLIAGQLALSINNGDTTANLAGLAGEGNCEHPLSGTDVEALWQRAQALSKAIKDEPVRLIVGETVTLEPVNPIAEAALLKAA